MNDPEIRALLLPLLTGGLVIDELPLGKRIGSMTRADLVHVTPSATYGYELKGDGDTLKRVPLQARLYGLAFDFVTFIVARKHLEPLVLSNVLPDWVGIAAVDTGGIDLFQPALLSPNTSPEALGELLWQQEVVDFLKAHQLVVPTRLRIWECREMLNDPAIELGALRAYVRQRLAHRYRQGARLRDKRAASLQAVNN